VGELRGVQITQNNIIHAMAEGSATAEATAASTATAHCHRHKSASRVAAALEPNSRTDVRRET
jgi:hypothetical protein